MWRIADSPSAPHFKVVSAPNEWGKKTKQAVRSRADEQVTERNERYHDFFQKLVDILCEKHRCTNSITGQPQNWHSFSAGYGERVRYDTVFAAGGKAQVALYIDNGDKDWNESLFDRLLLYREEIESDIGELDWRRLDGRRACRIVSERPGSIFDPQSTLDDVRDWMIEGLLWFKRMFGPGSRLSGLIEQGEGTLNQAVRGDEV